MRNMELTSGVTNDALAKEIKETLKESKSQVMHLVAPMPPNTAEQAYPSANLVRRRLSEFYNKQEMIQQDRAKKQAARKKKLQAQLALEEAELAFSKCSSNFIFHAHF